MDNNQFLSLLEDAWNMDYSPPEFVVTTARHVKVMKVICQKCGKVGRMSWRRKRLYMRKMGL